MTFVNKYHFCIIQIIFRTHAVRTQIRLIAYEAGRGGGKEMRALGERRVSCRYCGKRFKHRPFGHSIYTRPKALHSGSRRINIADVLNGVRLHGLVARGDRSQNIKNSFLKK